VIVFFCCTQFLYVVDVLQFGHARLLQTTWDVWVRAHTPADWVVCTARP
jgi:hypothetical protein